MRVRRVLVGTTAVLLFAGAASAGTTAPKGPFQFTGLAASAACTDGGNPAAPFVLPEGYAQEVVASEPQFQDLPDMHTLNETGPFAGRYLYRTHEVRSNGSVSVTDLWTGVTRTLAQRADWERLDGIVWTPWQTLLVAEEVTTAAIGDPDVPQARAGLVYEVDPVTGASVARPAIGSRSHEGLRFDPQGNLYGISESSPGSIFRFAPDRRGDLSSGQLSALKVVAPTGDRTGGAVRIPIDDASAQVDSNAAAAALGATGYNRPEDVEITTSTGNNRGGANTLYVAVTGRGVPYDNRILGIELQGAGEAFVYDYVREGVNAAFGEFESPDNLALDKNGNLYITEDPGTAPATRRGDDVWVAIPSQGAGQNAPASAVIRFLTLTDCIAEPSGIYFDESGTKLYVHAMHRGGDGLDKSVVVTRER